MSMDVSLTKGNCKSDGNSSLKQPAEKFGDSSIDGNYSSEPAHQETNADPKLEMRPSDAPDFISGSDVSGKFNFLSPRPDALLNDNGGVDIENVNNKQITDAEAAHNLPVPVVARDMVSGAEVCEELNFTPPRPHNPRIDREVMHTEVDNLVLELDAESKFVNSESTHSDHHKPTVGTDTRLELEEYAILTDKSTTFSEDASMNLVENMHSEEKKCELKIGPQTQVEEAGTKRPVILSEDEAGKHIGTSFDDEKVSSAAKHVGLQNERMACELNHDNSESPPPNGSKSPNPELLKPTLINSTENATHIRSRKRRKSAAETAAVSARILRSRSKDKPEAPLPSNAAAEVSDAAHKKRKRKRKQMKNSPVSEFLRMKNHLRYLLQRIKNEHNLIDAYSSEGWRKQSLDKIKPEKELQQAKSHILRYKLKIRDLFHRLDLSLTEGQIPESLFDSEGEIDSEDIFCAKCGSKDVTLDNDIILCDGACERGYHQFCLEPPLYKEDIPQGDEGWLCPGCDCKDDCIDLLNDFNGVKLSVLDNWEKVFPEAAAAAAGKTLEDGSALPSDDSDDDDYDPDRIEVDEELPDHETSSGDSDYLSASGGSSGSPAKPGSPTKEHFMGLLSEDSEDDDFDPNAPNDDDQVKEESSSDFTSDSEDLGAVLQDNTSIGDDEGQSNRDGDKLEVGVRVNRKSLKDEISYLLNSSESPISAKRHVERLDYKKLHDESYGNESSDSSDEDFEENVGRKRKRNVSGRIPGKGSASAGNESDIRQENGDQEKRSAKQARKKFDTKDGNTSAASHASSSEAGFGKSNRSKPPQRLGEAVTQRLLESFKKNQYLKRLEKEDLARELGLTIQQVAKWFENARWSSRHSATMETKGTPGSSRGQIEVKDKLKVKGQKNDMEVALSNENNIAASPGANLGAKLTQNGDVVEPPITDEAGEQKSLTLKSRKSKNKKDGQGPSSLQKCEGNSQVDSPDSRRVGRRGRLQSTSNADA